MITVAKTSVRRLGSVLVRVQALRSGCPDLATNFLPLINCVPLDKSLNLTNFACGVAITLLQEQNKILNCLF